MAAFDSFRRFVLLEVPAAPLPLVDNAIVSGAREFALGTGLLTTICSFSTVAGDVDYPLTVPAEHEPAVIIEASVNGGRFYPAQDGINTPRIDEPAGAPVSYELRLTDYAFVVHPVPDGAYPIVARVAYRPQLTASSLDDGLLPHQDAIAAYAKYKLMAQAGQPWSNPDGALQNLAAYSEAVARLRIAIERAGTAASLKVRPRRFG